MVTILLQAVSQQELLALHTHLQLGKYVAVGAVKP